MTTTPALLIAAGGVAFGHAVLPDHWVPLAVLGRTRRYPLRKVATLSGLAGIAHVLVSLLLGAVIVAVGLQFRSQFESVQSTIIGLLLIGTGVAFLVLEATGRGHHHGHAHDHAHAGHEHGHADAGHADAHAGHADAHAGHDHDHAHARHEHDHDHAGDEHDHAHAGHDHAHDRRHPPPRSRLASLAGVMVPFGAAASPDLTILPVFLAAAAVGTGTAIGSLAVFGAVTIATIVVLTVIAAAGGYQVRARWLDRWGNAITALVLIVIGALVLAGVL